MVEDSKLRLVLTILKESMENKKIDKLIHVDGMKMVADCLTKKGAPAKAFLRS